MRKVLFLDRDGVINVDVNYLYRIDDFAFVPGAPKALAAAVQAGYDLIVVTNQSGIARGYYTVEDMERLHAYINEELTKVKAPILAFYYCPHHVKGTVAAFTKDCDCRKPKPGYFRHPAMQPVQMDIFLHLQRMRPVSDWHRTLRRACFCVFHTPHNTSQTLLF